MGTLFEFTLGTVPTWNEPVPASDKLSLKVGGHREMKRYYGSSLCVSNIWILITESDSL